MIVIIVFLFGLNILICNDNFNYINKVYGFNYEIVFVEYFLKCLQEVFNSICIEDDKVAIIVILERWKVKIEEEKFWMVIFCLSGGGLKLVIWSMQVVCMVDSLFNG